MSLGRCPLWVINGNVRRKKRCPLYPQERTCAVLADVRFVPKADITGDMADTPLVGRGVRTNVQIRPRMADC